MFYSQFILAKKGPLGTIWIAAHLERKLRKNQVADTDIGVSVDSILSPDVPIALRLSSHLLLGVVRIYNKKVNYLFDDCSEALLKVKQAFRSTAVDLPPEQSKAPYNSITLPETFDLDDFELPDSEIFQGNYVDHHVSSKEQITLQDTMDGGAYSTTQFGLDERFGDGDTSGLDLDEDLFLDKVVASGHAGVSSSSDPQAAVPTMIVVKQDDEHEGTANSEPMIGRVDVVHLMEDAQAPCTPGLVEEPNLSNAQETSACDDHFESEHQHLTESTVKENLETFSADTDIHNGNKNMDEWSIPDEKISHSAVHQLSENGYPSDLDINQLRPQELSSAIEITVEHFSPVNHASASGPSSLLDKHVTQVSPVPELADKIVETSDFPNLGEHMHEGVVDNDKANMCSVHESLEDNERSDGINVKQSDHQILEGMLEYNHTSPAVEVSENLESAGILGKSQSPKNALDLDIDYPGLPCREMTERQTFINGQITGDQAQFLRPCNANIDQTPRGDNATLDSVEVSALDGDHHPSETPAVAQGEVCPVIDVSEKITRDNDMREGASDEGIPSVNGQSNDEVNNRISGGSPVENVNVSLGPDLPAPEKLMSVPEGTEDFPKNLLVESTPKASVRNDVGDAGTNVISGKKRSYTESALTEQSLKSIESSRIVRSKRTVDCIPDDDDLLSSILVGRRSSVLKVKPSPSPWDMSSVKRSHSAPRNSAVKRKVLMDDTMVLHGDTIRLQLMNTEDIRRVRKKAPCTCPEITMIQKQFLEDEIFIEPVYTGVSIELASLHHQTRDLSGIRISLDDVNCASLGTTTDIMLQNQDEDNNENLNAEKAEGSGMQEIAKQSEREGTNSLMIATENCEIESVEALSADMNRLDEDNIVQPQMEITTGLEPNSLLLAPPEDVAESEINVRSTSITDVVNVALPGLDESSLHIDQVSCDRGDTSTDLAQVAPVDENSAGVVQTTDNNKTCERDTSLHVDDAPDISHDKNIDKVSLQMDATGGEVVEGPDTVGKDCDRDHTAAVEADFQIGKEVLMGETEGDATVKTTPDATNRETEYDSHCLVDEGIDQSILDSFFPGEVNMHVEDVVLGDGEHPVQDIELTTIDAEFSAAWGHDDLNHFTAGNDTEFLNVDDELVEPTDDNIPNEEARIPDNSGWSSRTRAVSNFLQTLFAKQAGNARPTLSMDNLLVGKTRKEASRMFFEALVLKTKDYIHVEQGNPFENISINPHTKLMKSDF